MKRLLLLFAVFIAISGYSQKHFVGLKIGVNSMNTNGSFAGSARNHPKTGINTGVSYERFLNTQFSLSTEVMYNQRGFAIEYSGPSHTEYNFTYLSIPIKMNFVTGSRFYGIGSIGFVPAFLLKAEFVIPDILANPDVGKEDITDELTKVDIAGLVEFGCGYKVSKSLHVFASLSGQLSFNSFTTEDFFGDVDAKHYGISLSAGIKYSLLRN